MKTRFPAACFPNNASKANSSLAGNILESYKMIAEQLLLFHTREITSHASLCIEAARIHLESFCNCNSGPLQPHNAIYVCFDSCHGYCGCTVWLYSIASAQQSARALLEAFVTLKKVNSRDAAATMTAVPIFESTCTPSAPTLLQREVQEPVGVPAAAAALLKRVGQ